MADESAYSILNIHKGAGEAEIKQAYVEQVKKFNPERHPDKFIQIQKAYEKLRDPEQRAKEDVFSYNYVAGDFNWANDEKTEEEASAILDRIKKNEEIFAADATNATVKADILSDYQRLSYVHARQKLWSDAINDWTAILRIDATHQQAKTNLTSIFTNLGYFYAQQEMFVDSIKMWENALKLNPASLDIVHNLAIVSDKTEDEIRSKRYWTETIKRWKQNLDKNPDDAYLKALLVEVHRHHGGKAVERIPTAETREEAIANYRQVLNINPDDFDAAYSLSAALLEEKQFEESINILKQLLAKHPQNMDVVNQLGWSFLNAGKFEIAFNTWRRGLTMDPRNTGIRESILRARMAVGKKLKEGGHYTQALVHFKELDKMSPNQPEVHFEIGEIFLRRSDRRSALVCFQKVLELDPKHKGAKRAISDIKMR